MQHKDKKGGQNARNIPGVIFVRLVSANGSYDIN